MKSSHLYLFCILLFISSTASYSQGFKRGFNKYNRSSFSLELGAGVPKIISPKNDVNIGDAGIFSAGLRYLPERSQLGIRGLYSYSNISDSKVSGTNHKNMLEIHRLELQGIYMLNVLLNLPDDLSFDLESYLGFGAAFGMPSSISNSNRMLSASVGLRPRLLINNDNLYFYLDASYATLINQQWDYSGHVIPNAKKGNFESMVQISIGLSYKL